MKPILLPKKNYLNAILFLLILFSIEGKAATKTYVSGSVWSSMVWSPSGTPVAGDDLVFNLGTTALTITSMPAISFNSITVNATSASGILTFTPTTSGSIITISNGFIVNSPAIFKSGTGAIIKIGNGSSVNCSGSVYANSNGVIDLNGQAVTFSGGLFILGTGISSGGALINTSATASVVTGSVTMGSSSSINTTGDITLSGVVSGATFALSKIGTGTLVLNGSNTYSGGTTISAGSIKLGTNSGLGTGTTTVSSGAVLDLNGSTTTNALILSGTLTNTNASLSTNSGAVTLTTAATINATNPITLSGIISSTGTLTKTGTGTLTLSGSNTNSGLTTITSGIIQISAAERIANTTAIALNGGTLSTGATTGFTETVGTLALTDNSTIALGTGAHTLTFAASNGVSWTTSKTLSITGWTGNAGASGGGGKIFFGSSATTLTATQLLQITFSIVGNSYSAKLLTSGELVPNVVCSSSAPTTQAAELTFNTINKTAIDASFTGASPATNYLIVRTTGGTPTNPQNGTSYTSGSSALGGTIIASTTSTFFSDTGLTANTAYSYFIYSYSLNCNGTNPNYNTSNALTKSVTTSNTTNTWYVNDASTSGDLYTTAIGNGLNSGLTKSAPLLTLGAAITAASAGDVIYVDAGTFSDKSLNINKSLTIIGAGTALTFFNGNNLPNVFCSITSSNVTLKNMDILQYMMDTSGSGQVININGAYTGIIFDNVLINKSLGGNSTAANLNIVGGANVVVKNSLFKCSGFNGSVGGGISVNASTLTVTNTIFFNNDNSIGLGGAIGVVGSSNLTVTNCTFDTNTARDGGAIAIGGTTTATITGSCFLNNKTEGSSPSITDGGGAIYSSTSGTVSITDCSFTNNCTGGGTNTLTGSLVSCLGSGNSPQGGAIRQTAGTMNLTRVSFSGNTSAKASSAYDIQKDAGTMTLSQVKFNSVATGTYVNVVNTAGSLTFADSGTPTATPGGVALTNPEVTGTTITTNTNTPSATIATVCSSTSTLISCGSTTTVNCSTETIAPVIVSCVPNKTISCPATLPDYTAEVNAYDDCTFTVTQSPVAGTSLLAGATTITMTVTDAHGNSSTCTFTVTVSSATAGTNFGDIASAVGLSSNGGTTTSFYNTTGTGDNLIGTSTFSSTDLGVFTPSSGTLKLTGAELRTWKTNTGNVCGGALNYVVYTTGARPAVPVFQSFAIPLKANCSASAYGDGIGTCTTGDQKWNTTAQSIDLTTYAAGNYTIEAYYSYTGSDTGGCGTTQYLNNSCTNYKATFTLGNCTGASITSNPMSSQSVCQNNIPTNLTVVASGSTILNYQWYSNTTNSTIGGSSLGSANGAQTSTYTPPTTAIGTIYYYCTITNSCGSATTTTAAVVVSAAVNAGSISGTQNVYVGATTTFSSNGSSGGVFTSSNTAIASVNNNSGVITGVSTGTATITYTVTGTGGCSNASATRTVTVSIAPTVAGTISGDQSICKDSEPSALTLTGNTGNVIKWQKAVDYEFTSPIDIASTATTLTGATMGNTTSTTYYRAVVQNEGSNVAYTNVVTISVPYTTWDGSTWSNGVPTIITTAYITGDYSLAADIFACTLTVSNNAVVSIPSGYDVTLNGKLTVDSGSSFTLNNNSNLIQQTDVSNSGAITVKRMSHPVYRLDYTLWSSPVFGGQTLYNFSPLTANIAPANIRFYIYNTQTSEYNSVNPLTTTFEAAKGYLIRCPNNWLPFNSSLSPAPQKWTGMFTGTPRNGDISFTLTHTDSETDDGMNATGNPYPSALSITDFINGNSNTIEGTLWFWRKYNDSDNLISYSTCSTIGCALTNNAAYTDSNLISAGQGFMVKAIAGQTNLNFTNAMRSSENVDQFYKSTTLQMDRFWIKTTNSTNVSAGQNLIAYTPNATNEYDSGLDGLYYNNSDVAFYSTAGTRNVVINARPSFTANDVIPIIFKTNINDTYTFSLNQKEGIFNGTQDVLLKDNYTNTIHNLSQGDYSFATEAGLFSDRFEIVYQNPLTTHTTVFQSNQVIVYNQDHLTHINSGNIPMESLKIFDIQGRLLYHKTGINTTKMSLDLGFANQALLFQITSIDGEIVIKKVIN